MIIAGIDPGLTGAACIFDAEGMNVVDIIDLPTEPWGTKRHIEVPSLTSFIWSNRADTAALERVNAMPSMGPERRSMGAASAFRFGMCYGEVRGSLIACGLRVVDVPPTTWKDLFELRKRPKDDARDLAAMLHPEVAHLLKRKKDIGRAECVLIARWAALNRYENR